MESSWLVQRLKKPYQGDQDNPFVFGGGLRNGGLSPDAMGLLRGIFQFDYMGAAEFEFGAVPKTLRRIAQSTEAYHAFVVTWPLSEVDPLFRKPAPIPTGEATVYVICQNGWDEAVTRRIKGWAGPWDRRLGLKEDTLLSYALRPPPDVADRLFEQCGWLELDNGFFFFTDKEMWEKTAQLFGVEVPS